MSDSRVIKDNTYVFLFLGHRPSYLITSFPLDSMLLEPKILTYGNTGSV